MTAAVAGTFASAAALYAHSQGLDPNRGIDAATKEDCHWCGGPCVRGKFPHLNPPPIIGPKPKFLARRPGNGYVCLGCWLWGRPSITVDFLDKAPPKYRDRQTPRNHNWLITPERAVAVRQTNDVYPTLLKPPCVFTLALREGEDVPNHLHCALLNDNAEIRADTPLYFTLNNIPLIYTVYELEMGLRGGDTGKLPGVQALLRLFGDFELPPSAEDKRQQAIAGKPKGGRPEPLQDAKALGRQVTLSGKF